MSLANFMKLHLPAQKHSNWGRLFLKLPSKLLHIIHFLFSTAFFTPEGESCSGFQLLKNSIGQKLGELM